MVNTIKHCPVCGGHSKLLDVVDFNKSCEEVRGKFLPVSGIPIYYSHCENCSFTFAPQIYSWSEKEFIENIYNESYFEVDPDYLEIRPQGNASLIKSILNEHRQSIRHLDYGGGNGKLSELLAQDGWHSHSYDPFVNGDVNLADLGKFDLITAFEVFEHVPDVNALIKNLLTVMSDDSLILFSTLILDGYVKTNSRITWWYASPRNGHISLYSKKSLQILAQKNKLNLASFNNGLHCYFKQVPSWAKHIIKQS